MANQNRRKAEIGQIVDRIIENNPAKGDELKEIVDRYQDGKNAELLDSELNLFMKKIFTENLEELPPEIKDIFKPVTMKELISKCHDDELSAMYSVFVDDDEKNAFDFDEEMSDSEIAAKRDELLGKISDAMLSGKQLSEKFSVVGDRTISAFEKAMNDEILYADDYGALSVLDDINYIAIYMNGLSVLIPTDLRDAYKGIATEEFHENRRKIHRLLGCIYMFSNLYEEASLKVLLRLYNKAAGKDNRITKDELLNLIKALPMQASKNIEITGDDGNESLKILNIDDDEHADVDTLSKYYQLFIPPEDEVVDIVEYRWPKHTKAYEAVEKYLTSQAGVPYTEISWILETTWQHFTAGYNVSEVIDFYVKAGIIPDNREITETLTVLLDAAAMNTRMYELRGSTPEELGLRRNAN